MLNVVDKQFPVEQFEATVYQSTVPSPPLITSGSRISVRRLAAAASKSGGGRQELLLLLLLPTTTTTNDNITVTVILTHSSSSSYYYYHEQERRRAAGITAASLHLFLLQLLHNHLMVLMVIYRLFNFPQLAIE